VGIDAAAARPLSRRGPYPRHLPCLSTGFPFGLERRRKTLDAPKQILVLPRTWPIIGMPSPRRLPSFDGAAESNRSGTTGTTLGVRPFRRGDGRRDVHWRQTARHGRLIVRERETPERAQVRLVVDASRTSCGTDNPDAVLDWLARFAASIAEQIDATTAAVELASSARPCSAAVRGAAIGDALARLELGESSSSRTFCEAAKHVSRSVEPWFLTTPAGYFRLSAEERAAAGWTFFVLEVDESEWRTTVTSDPAARRRTFTVSLLTGSTLDHFAEEGTFHVRARG
jgi:uncharacterized protein (DUF58 family)